MLFGGHSRDLARLLVIFIEQKPSHRFQRPESPQIQKRGDLCSLTLAAVLSRFHRKRLTITGTASVRTIRLVLIMVIAGWEGRAVSRLPDFLAGRDKRVPPETTLRLTRSIWKSRCV